MLKGIFKYSTLASAMLFACAANASDFNLPFISASGLGNLYSDWATNTEDASNAFSNPAGLPQLHHEQLVFAPLAIIGSAKFTGSTTLGFPPFTTETGSASTRIFGFVPSFYYALPVNDRLTVAFSETVPFALGTNYEKDSIVRYLSTTSKIVVIDIGPSLGYQVNDKFSIGVGLDANHLAFTLNNMNPSPFPGPDLETQNNLSGWGYGWHAGLLYQLQPATRVGLSFNSMVMFHTGGSSELFYSFPPGSTKISNQQSNAALPARTQLSIHHDFNDRVAVMGTVFYTHWSTFKQLTMRRVVIAPDGTTLSITYPFNYRNTFDYSVGMNYKATPKLMLRGGLEWMNAPSNDTDRAVADPVAQTFIVGLGAHYQQNVALGYDFGLAHSFFRQAAVGASTPVVAASGHINTQTTVVGAQVTWNIT